MGLLYALSSKMTERHYFSKTSSYSDAAHFAFPVYGPRQASLNIGDPLQLPPLKSTRTYSTAI